MVVLVNLLMAMVATNVYAPLALVVHDVKLVCILHVFLRLEFDESCVFI